MASKVVTDVRYRKAVIRWHEKYGHYTPNKAPTYELQAALLLEEGKAVPREMLRLLPRELHRDFGRMRQNKPHAK